MVILVSAGGKNGLFGPVGQPFASPTNLIIPQRGCVGPTRILHIRQAAGQEPVV